MLNGPCNSLRRRVHGISWPMCPRWLEVEVWYHGLILNHSPLNKWSVPTVSWSIKKGKYSRTIEHLWTSIGVMFPGVSLFISHDFIDDFPVVWWQKATVSLTKWMTLDCVEMVYDFRIPMKKMNKTYFSKSMPTICHLELLVLLNSIRAKYSHCFAGYRLQFRQFRISWLPAFTLRQSNMACWQNPSIDSYPTKLKPSFIVLSWPCLIVKSPNFRCFFLKSLLFLV